VKIKKCLDCKIELPKAHLNTKRCNDCRLILSKRPKGTMTAEQIAEAKRLAGTMPRDEIAKRLGVSLTNLKRSCPNVKFIYYYFWKNNPDLVLEICKYYEKNGKMKTQEKYPDIKIRSIIEHYKLFKPRQIKWKENELIELAKFAGIVPLKQQAKFFNRPRANSGSIKSVWYKKFKTTPCYMHGMPIHKAKIFLEKGFPMITVKRQISGDQTRLALWCDAVFYIRKDCPDFVRDAINAMAEFQNKLFNGNPRMEIENILACFN